MAINYLRDSWRIYHPEDAFQEEEENSNEYKKKRRAYWKV
jgi:hypothetical protein